MFGEGETATQLRSGEVGPDDLPVSSAGSRLLHNSHSSAAVCGAVRLLMGQTDACSMPILDYLGKER